MAYNYRRLGRNANIVVIYKNHIILQEFPLIQSDFLTHLTQLNITLSPQQLTAVQAVEGPVLLLAVPGSGKTTVLVTRLGYMVKCCSVYPEEILTLTYTVAATKDMAERFRYLFGSELALRMEFRTINGICSKVIYEYGRRIGKTAFELLTDEKQIAGMLSQIYVQEAGEYPTESDLQSVRSYITYIKNSMLSESEIREFEKMCEGIPIARIYQRYCSRMREEKLMDYDDQLLHAYTILKKVPQVLSEFQKKYHYICVDEAQDTSKIQHEIIKLLAGANDNLFMVGDEDQSIYGFRAAYPQALLDFEKDHKNAKVLLMEENFRSNARIVERADHFIRKNTLRHKKEMHATREPQQDVHVIELSSRGAQHTYLAKVANGCSEQTAVLYRDNESVIPLVDLLEYEQIPYRIKNAELGFFTHRIVQDIRNIITFALNPYDTESFMQIYYKLNMYLKKLDAMQAVQISVERDIPVLDAAIGHCGLKARTVSSLKSIRTHLNHMRTEQAGRAIGRIVQYMGYREYLERAGLKENKVFILKNIAARTDMLQDFLNRLSYLQDVMQHKEPAYDCPFILSTIHSSKGLEYDRVYLLDILDGVFPEEVPAKRLDGKELESYEEERRIFYVGVTRAREELYLFATKTPSLFRDQLLGRSVKAVNTVYSAYSKTLMQGYAQENTIDEAAYQAFEEGLQPGAVVHHKKFGAGKVISQVGNKVSIRFAGEQAPKVFDRTVLYRSHLLS